MTIRVAHVGTGYIARFHIRALQKQPDVEITAAVDNRQDALNAFANEYGIPRRYTSIDALLRDGGVDAIVLAVPNSLHAPMSISAMEAGVQVMVEKPMAANAYEAERMAKISQSTGMCLFIAHCWRFEKEVLWLRKQVVEEKIGKMVRTKGYGVHVNWGPSGWFKEKRYGGGALADMGIHAIDTARFLIGDPQPESIYARISTSYGDYDVDDTGIIIVNWDNGVTSYIESGWWQPHSDGPEAATQVYGTNGFGQIFPSFITVPNVKASTLERIESGFPTIRVPHCEQDMYDNQIYYFISCLRNHQKPKLGAIDGLINMKIVDAAYESAKSGKVIRL